MPILGTEVKGSKRWLDFFFLPRFQPIEVVKPFTIIFIALILSSEKSWNIYLNIFKLHINFTHIFFINDTTRYWSNITYFFIMVCLGLYFWSKPSVNTKFF